MGKKTWETLSKNAQSGDICTLKSDMTIADLKVTTGAGDFRGGSIAWHVVVRLDPDALARAAAALL